VEQTFNGTESGRPFGENLLSNRVISTHKRLERSQAGRHRRLRRFNPLDPAHYGPVAGVCLAGSQIDWPADKLV
jgi:hypothetical protein